MLSETGCSLCFPFGVKVGACLPVLMPGWTFRLSLFLLGVAGTVLVVLLQPSALLSVDLSLASVGSKGGNGK